MVPVVTIRAIVTVESCLPMAQVEVSIHTISAAVAQARRNQAAPLAKRPDLPAQCRPESMMKHCEAPTAAPQACIGMCMPSLWRADSYAPTITAICVS
jgi:hypothetical protein